jgi:hypothetical protein
MVSNYHQYQQNEQSPLPQTAEYKKTMRYHGVANPGVGFGQAHKCGRAKPADEIDPPKSDLVQHVFFV